MKFRSDRMRIAVIGRAFRMPGVGGEHFWDALLSGADLVSSVPSDRWAQDSLLHPRKGEPGTAYTFAAGSLGDVAGFDAAFFGVSPREAEQMDPQQRLLLEMAWETFEDAGVPAAALRGARCGVYIGLSSIDYAYRRADDLGCIDATTMTGNAGSIAANRLSYTFDLRGPSMVIDTACSSSLVALHQACQSIRHGESEAALVGGISLHLHPYAFIGFSKASMLSRQGRCSVFGADGDGYVRAEGGAVLLLKPLAQAISDGNRILGVIAETGVNNDGRKGGLTVPSHVAQGSLLREIYTRAGITPAEIDYLEAHGTGTAVGDPLEARALGEALGQRRPRGQPLPIGSVKSNVGHLEAAAGMAGLIKALYVLQHRRVPANLHLERLNPEIDFASLNLSPVAVPLELATDRRVVVGVSAFGFGGTNAHAILTSFEEDSEPAQRSTMPQAPLMLSARSPGALREVARRMARHLETHPDLSDYDIAYSALHARDIHTHRLSVGPAERATLVRTLERFAESGETAGVLTGGFRRDASPPAFVFSGNGSQWVGMGVQLLEEEPTFLEAVEEVDALYAEHAGWSILSELRAAPAAARLDRTEIAQPVLFAIQVGLTRALDHQRIQPVAVCGHSVGEVAAAWASGALTLPAAVQVIHERSLHQGRTRGRGAMVAVELGEAAIGALLQSLGLHTVLTLAASNAAGSVTLAGDEAAVSQLTAALKARKIVSRRLPLDYAFHSAAMDDIRQDLLRSLSGVRSRAPAIAYYSTVTGSQIEGAELGANYWWRNVREPVRFHAAIQAMLAAGINTFIEIGPRPVLSSYIKEITSGSAGAAFVLPAVTSSDCGQERLRSVCQQLELSGALPDATRLFPAPGRRVKLPHYPWQRERHWHPTTTESLGLLQRQLVHPLLGYALPGEPYHWENRLDTARLPALADHAVGGSAVFPAAGFVEMALAAASIRRPDARPVIEDLEILAPLLLDDEQSTLVRLRIDDGDGSFAISSRARGAQERWRTHAVGQLLEGVASTALTCPLALQLPARAPDVTGQAHYALAQSFGLAYGPAFQSVSAAWFCEPSGNGPAIEDPPAAGATTAAAAIVGTLTLPACIADTSAALLHPAFLDGALQLLLDLAQHGRSTAKLDAPMPTFLPVRFGRVELLRPAAPVAAAHVRARLPERQGARSFSAQLLLYDAQGGAVARIEGVRFRATRLQRADPGAACWLTSRAIAMPRRDGPQAVSLPAPQEAVALAAEHLHAPERLLSRQRYAQEVEPLLDILCAAFAERAVRAVAQGASLDPDELVAAGCLSATAAPLFRRLLQMLAEEELVECTDEHWHWRSTGSELRFPPPQEVWTTLIGDYPEHAAVCVRLGSAGLHLSERLRAGVAAEGREHAAPVAYSWMNSCTEQEAAALFDGIEEVLGAALRSQPAHARPRVLHVIGATLPEELGAAMLPGLDPDRCESVLAAPTRELLDELRLRATHAAKLAGHAIDFDQAGAEQLEALGRFDLIVLSHGIADAADPRYRLQQLRSLLFDAGLLLVIEQPASRTEDLIRSLDAPWWRTGSGGEALGPPRSRRQCAQTWMAALTRSGFTEVAALADTPGASSGPYLLIARADAPIRVRSAPAIPATQRTWLLLQDHAGYSAKLGAALAAELSRRGQRLVLVQAARDPLGGYRALGEDRFEVDAASAVHWRALLEELQRAGKAPDAWVHLAGLRSSSESTSPEARATALMAWLQACSRCALSPDSWVIASQVGATLLPPGAAGARPGGDAPSINVLQDAALWGLTRVAVQEFPELALRWLDLVDPLPCAARAAQLADELLHPDAENEILLSADGRFVTRLGAQATPPVPTRAASEPSAPVRLDFSMPGTFRNLLWRSELATADIGRPEPLAADEVEVQVCAAGLNFRDIMYSMGLLPDEALEAGFCGPTLGMELAGRVLRVGPGVADLAVGDEVLGMAPAAFATRARTRAFALTRKPAGWSFAAAASVPSAFFTAYYALVELAALKAGERVLVHGAAGGVGIAAIQLARHLGARVLATAGSDEKRDVVALLGADQVFDSRSLGFADDVLQATAGCGVDVVLNSLAGEAMRRNLRLLRPFGRMIELGKRDFYENTRLGLRPFRNNIAYFGVDADQLLAQRPDTARRVFEKLMELFAAGQLRPLPHRCFKAADIEAAFRHMQASRHIGKIVVRFDDFEPEQPSSVQRTALRLWPDATYLVTGGLSGFGLRTAEWLAQRGARHLALLSRRGTASPEEQPALERLSAAGVNVRPIACDVADGAALRSALAALDLSMPALRGIVHAAAVIEDALIRDLEAAQLQRVIAPKLSGALHLHEATLGHPLDFFVLYSSATTQFGNPGQAAYVAANMGLEALAAERRALGLPATCVCWGPIGDTGYLARNTRVRDALVGRLGGRALDADEALGALEAALTAGLSQIGVLELDWSVLSRSLPAAAAPRFSELAREDQPGLRGHESAHELRLRLAQLPAGELLPALIDIVRREAAQILRLAPDRIDSAAPLGDVGMDSLMGVELALSLEATLGVQLSALSLSDAPTIARVAARLAQQLQPREDGCAAASDAARSDEVRLLAGRYASEISGERVSELSAELGHRDSPLALTGGQS